MTGNSVATDLFQVMPPLSTDEFSELKSDIQARGVMVPIEYDEAGNILDVAGFNSNRSKLVTLKPGLVKGWWKISWIDFIEKCEFVSDKDIATSRLYWYLNFISVGRPFLLKAIKRSAESKLSNHCVYFIYAAAANLVKIGTTDGNAESRMRQIATMSPVALYVVGSIPGDHKVEKDLHRQFKNYRKHGEWFCVSGALKSYLFDHFGFIGE